MDHEERRGRVQQFLDDLGEQRDVDTRGALMELIHLAFELDDDVKTIQKRVSQLEARTGTAE